MSGVRGLAVVFFLMAGCSGGLLAPTSDAGADGATSSGGSSSSSSGGSSSSSSGASRGGSSTSSSSSSGGADASTDAAAGCPGAPPAADPPWNPPPAPKNVCTADDIAFIQTAANQQGSTFATVEAQLAARNAACASCVFTHDTDPAWGPIVWVSGGNDAFVNFGACFATAPGGSVACGRAVQQVEICLDVVCDRGVCGTDSAVQKCVQQSLKAPSSCGKYDVATACPNLASLGNVCGTAFDAIRVACGASGDL